MNIPSIMTEIHRYSPNDKGEGQDYFGFHGLEQDDSINGYVELLGTTYAETTRDLIDAEAAEETRKALTELGYQPKSLDEVPLDLRHFVIFLQAPIGWHEGLEEREPEVTKRVTVWVKEA